MAVMLMVEAGEAGDDEHHQQDDDAQSAIDKTAGAVKSRSKRHLLYLLGKWIGFRWGYAGILRYTYIFRAAVAYTNYWINYFIPLPMSQMDIIMVATITITMAPGRPTVLVHYTYNINIFAIEIIIQFYSFLITFDRYNKHYYYKGWTITISQCQVVSNLLCNQLEYRTIHQWTWINLIQAHLDCIIA